MKTFIIAEAGVNHNGSVEIAKQLIDEAKKAEVDAIKFQSFKGKNIIRKGTQKADYQKQQTGNDEDQLSMVSKLELSEDDHHQIFQYAREKNIEVISTPFDLESVDLLEKLEVHRYKIPSGEITNPLLLFKVAKTQKPIILSTGMATIGEIERALSILSYGLGGDSEPTLNRCIEFYGTEKAQNLLKEYVTILHCTTQYPAPIDEVNLNVIGSLKSAFDLNIGYSDHTEGIGVSLAAVALGGKMIEKHFTLDRKMPGPDHSASIEPGELCELVKEIRRVEGSLGRSQKLPTPSEVKNIPIVRRSIVAKKSIVEGEELTLENLTLKRPGTGLDPMKIWELIGQKAKKNYQEDDFIE